MVSPSKAHATREDETEHPARLDHAISQVLSAALKWREAEQQHGKPGERFRAVNALRRSIDEYKDAV